VEPSRILENGGNDKFLVIPTLAKCALLGAGVLVIANQFVPAEVHAYLSSLPLALAGVGYILLQVHLKPPRRTLFKRLVLAGAFLLWAAVQFLTPGRLSVFLGDAVIAAYVVDLFWIMQDQQRALPSTHPRRDQRSGGCHRGSTAGGAASDPARHAQAFRNP
jgi:hypothetical protein